MIILSGGGTVGVGAEFVPGLYERFFWSGRTQEPGEPLIVNKASSLTQGLVFLAYPGGAHWHDLVNGGLAARAGGSIGNDQWLVGSTHLRYGYGKGSGDPENASYPWAPLMGTITDQCTIAVWLSVSSLQNFSELLCIPYRDGSWTSPFGAMEFVRNGTTSGCNFTYAASGSQIAVSSDTSMISADNVLRLYMVTRSGATVTFYKDGFQHGATKTLGTNSATDFNGGHPVTLGNRSPSSNGNSMGGTYTMAGIWNRAYSPNEVALLYLKPLTLLKPRLGENYGNN